MFRSLLTRRRRGTAAAACAALLSAAALAGCGGSSGSSGDASPAEAVPAGAPMYLEAVLRPEGQQHDDVEAALRKLLATDDPDAKIHQLLESGDSDVDWSKDIEPWLGQRAGLFFTSFAGDSPVGAAVIDSRDDDKARAFLKKDAEQNDSESQTYKDVDYWVDGDTAEGVVDGYVVVGSPSGLRTVVDTVKGDGATLAGDQKFQDALDAVGSGDALGSMYINAEDLVDSISRSGGIPPQALQSLRQALAGNGGTVAAKLSADADALTMEIASKGAASGSSDGDSGDAAAALKGVPGDAWLGVGIGALGQRLEQALAQVGQVGGLAGVDVNQLLAQIGQAAGIDVQKDLLSWMGDAALFARGSSVADIGGALVVQSSDPAKTRTAVQKLGRFLSQVVSSVRVRPLAGVSGVDEGLSLTSPGDGSSFEVLLAAAGSKFVAAVGRPALQAALKPSGTLGDSEDYQAAAGKLGDVEPTFFFDVGPVLRLASAFGAGSDPDFAQARRYLDHLGAIAAGSNRDGDTQHGRLVLTLK